MVSEPTSKSANSRSTASAFGPTGARRTARRRAEELLKAAYTSIVDADLKSGCDTIPHDRLLALVAQKVTVVRILAWIEGFLEQGVLDGLRESNPGIGAAPQGAVVTALFAPQRLECAAPSAGADPEPS